MLSHPNLPSALWHLHHTGFNKLKDSVEESSSSAT
jgi:hypothetical protein